MFIIWGMGRQVPNMMILGALARSPSLPELFQVDNIRENTTGPRIFSFWFPGFFSILPENPIINSSPLGFCLLLLFRFCLLIWGPHWWCLSFTPGCALWGPYGISGIERRSAANALATLPSLWMLAHSSWWVKMNDENESLNCDMTVSEESQKDRNEDECDVSIVQEARDASCLFLKLANSQHWLSCRSQAWWFSWFVTAADWAMAYPQNVHTKYCTGSKESFGFYKVANYLTESGTTIYMAINKDLWKCGNG